MVKSSMYYRELLGRHGSRLLATTWRRAMAHFFSTWSSKPLTACRFEEADLAGGHALGAVIELLP